MARFYFDIDDGERLLRDERGAEADSLSEVREAAIAVLPDMAKDVLPDGDHRFFSVNVRDENDQVIFRASLAFNAHWVRPGGATH